MVQNKTLENLAFTENPREVTSLSKTEIKHIHFSKLEEMHQPHPPPKGQMMKTHIITLDWSGPKGDEMAKAGVP